MKKDKIELALLVKSDVDTYSFRGTGTDYGHVTARFVKLEEGKVRNITDGYDFSFYYDGLTITSQQDSSRPEKVYGWDFRYKDAYSVSHRAVKKMAKTMAKIERGLDNLYKEWGEASSFPEYVLRIAKIMGVKTFLFEVEINGSSYDDNEYQFETNFADARYQIERKISDNADRLQGKAA